MISCSKIYKDVPFAHRQPRHDGRCAYIHGHNWDFEFEFCSKEMDGNGFVIDFGKLKFIKEYLDKYDHGLVVEEGDPELYRWRELNGLGLANVTVVPDVSAEGFAVHLYNELNPLVQAASDARAWIHSVKVWEDSKDSALYIPEGV